MQRRLTRKEFLELRRAGHEAWLRRQRRYGGFSIETPKGSPDAIVRGLEDGFVLRFPRKWLLKHDALTRLGF